MTLRRISTVPALVVAAAVALAACGGSGHAHSTTADHRAPADSTSSTITTKVVTAATSTTPVGSSAASFPKEFVAVSRSTARPGVTEYSSTTGKPMRRLTD